MVRRPCSKFLARYILQFKWRKIFKYHGSHILSKYVSADCSEINAGTITSLLLTCPNAKHATTKIYHIQQQTCVSSEGMQRGSLTTVGFSIWLWDKYLALRTDVPKATLFWGPIYLNIWTVIITSSQISKKRFWSFQALNTRNRRSFLKLTVYTVAYM